MVSGRTIASSSVGIGLTVLEKVTRHAPTNRPSQDSVELLEALDNVRRSVSRQSNTIEIARGVKVFDGNKIYMVKPIGQRFWTQTAALNDADEIAGTILIQTTGGVHEYSRRADRVDRSYRFVRAGHSQISDCQLGRHDPSVIGCARRSHIDSTLPNVATEPQRSQFDVPD
jgi:hypothetical protein